MQEQEKQEKILQLINLHAINKFVQKMNASKTKNVTLQGRSGDIEMSLLDNMGSLISLDDFSKN
jgi:hypothetical protein